MHFVFSQWSTKYSAHTFLARLRIFLHGLLHGLLNVVLEKRCDRLCVPSSSTKPPPSTATHSSTSSSCDGGSANFLFLCSKPFFLQCDETGEFLFCKLFFLAKQRNPLFLHNFFSCKPCAGGAQATLPASRERADSANAGGAPSVVPGSRHHAAILAIRIVVWLAHIVCHDEQHGYERTALRDGWSNQQCCSEWG